MNNKTIGITALCSAAIIAATIFGISYISTPQEPVYRAGHGPPADPILIVTGGKPVPDINQAKTLVGYDVKLPDYLPQGYQVRKIAVDKDIGLVTILASKFPVTEKTTDIGFTWNDVGLWITVSKVPQDFDKANYLNILVTEMGYKSVIINGEQGAVHEIRQQEQDGEIVHAPAVIVSYKGDVQLFIRGFFSAAELQQIAEST